MTLRSLRKRQITRWNTRLTRLSALAFVAAFLFSNASVIAQSSNNSVRLRPVAPAAQNPPSKKRTGWRARFGKKKTGKTIIRTAAQSGEPGIEFQSSGLRPIPDFDAAPTAKPSGLRAPVQRTSPPQYQRPVRRLADLPLGRRRGYTKSGQEDDPILDDFESQFGSDDEMDEGDEKSDDDDDFNLDPDDAGASDSVFGREDDRDVTKTDIRNIRPFIGYALEGIRGEDLPKRQSTPINASYVPPQRQPIMYHWAASNLHHNPLYFEDPSLERYGHSYNPLIQPFASAGRMTAQLIGLPYQMTIDPIQRRRYTLGWIRPGDCAPKLKYQVPLNKKAAMVEGAALLGAGLILP